MNPLSLGLAVIPALFAVVAFLVKSPIVRRWAIICLATAIAIREFSIGQYHRIKVEELSQAGAVTSDFAEGAMLIARYCDLTGYVVLLYLLLIIVLSYRSYGTKNANHSIDA